MGNETTRGKTQGLVVSLVPFLELEYKPLQEQLAVVRELECIGDRGKLGDSLPLQSQVNLGFVAY